VEIGLAGERLPPISIGSGVTEFARCGIISHMPSTQATDDATSLVDEAEFAKRLSGSAASIAKAVADGTLFFVMDGGKKLYPSFFADATLKRRQLSAVSRLLKDLNGYTKWQFFVGGKGSLGGLTPLAALREGKLRQVKAAAEGYAER
jgi:hypothetical protein